MKPVQHAVSAEKHDYYLKIIKACVDRSTSHELVQIKTEALRSLALDPSLKPILPYICNFIADGVAVNIIQLNFVLLVDLMKMVESLVSNQALDLEKYLHQLVPAVMSCMLSKQLCPLHSERQYNQWDLRKFASHIVAKICIKYNTDCSSLKTRIVQLCYQCMIKTTTPLPTVYGAIYGLFYIDMAKIVPTVPLIADRIHPHLDGSSLDNCDREAASRVQQLIINVMEVSDHEVMYLHG